VIESNKQVVLKRKHNSRIHHTVTKESF